MPVVIAVLRNPAFRKFVVQVVLVVADVLATEVTKGKKSARS